MTALYVRRLGGGVDYATAWHAMQDFNAARSALTLDELWLLEHAPVYTRGRNAREIAPPGVIPTVDTDRGGDLTYHGPGQLVAYTLLDLTRLGLGVRHLVSGLEAVILGTLSHFGITGHTRPKAPGVYVDDAKIASLGLRIRSGRSYHGLALNVAMNLAPFRPIAPCGYRGLRVTQVADCGGPQDIDVIAASLTQEFLTHFGFTPKEESP
ncbi:MAG: lipoyl(octanoyl) transferase LipB [Acidiferrobacter sp.]